MNKAQRRKAEKMKLIEEMWKDGHTLEEIGEATGYKTGTIGVYLSDHHLRTPDRCENHLEEIVEMWTGGETLKFISKKVGFSVTQVHNVISKYGLGRRTKNIGVCNEPDLIDANTVFAEKKKEKPERIFACGKWYVTVPESEIYQN